jgi:hypothetical protein
MSNKPMSAKRPRPCGRQPLSAKWGWMLNEEGTQTPSGGRDSSPCEQVRRYQKDDTTADVQRALGHILARVITTRAAGLAMGHRAAPIPATQPPICEPRRNTRRTDRAAATVIGRRASTSIAVVGIRSWAMFSSAVGLRAHGLFR